MRKLILLFGLLLPAFGQAQSYSISWYKIAGGGGTSTDTNGQYSVSGTIGQPDAGGPLSGGGYSLTGGFWSLLAVQSPGVPLLRIFLTATNTAVVAWPYPSTGFTLQVNTDPATANWSPAGGTVNVVGGENQIVVSPSIGNRFYRLKQ